ncbi:hypothetical protein D1007_59311 [Hordeum vulgare]|nr:hypothetical protein D1007_59311 [Hordeum vulgare]
MLHPSTPLPPTTPSHHATAVEDRQPPPPPPPPPPDVIRVAPPPPRHSHLCPRARSRPPPATQDKPQPAPPDSCPSCNQSSRAAPVHTAATTTTPQLPPSSGKEGTTNRGPSHLQAAARGHREP